MHGNDAPHHLLIGEGDVVEVAAAEKGVGEVFLGVGGDNDHRPVPRSYGPVDLDDVELHLVEHIEHVVLEVGVSLVDLVDQQHHPLICDKGLTDFSHPDILRDIAHISRRVAEAAVVQAGQSVVVIQGFDQLHARLHVEHEKRHPQALGNGVRQHGLAGAGLPLEQKWHLQGHSDIDDLGKLFVQYISACAAELVEIIFCHDAVTPGFTRFNCLRSEPVRERSTIPLP